MGTVGPLGNFPLVVPSEGVTEGPNRGRINLPAAFISKQFLPLCYGEGVRNQGGGSRAGF